MHNKGIGTWIHRRRVKSAGSTALILGETSIGYDVLAERIDRLANALARLGVARGDRIAFLGENHPTLLETLFAAGTLGAVFVPLNTRSAAPELTYVLRDCGATTLIHSADLTPLAASGAGGTPVTHRIVADGPVVDDPEWDHLERIIARAPVAHRDEPVELTDPAVIMYTSGTTGQPKGAVLSHGNITWNSFNVLVDYEISAQSIALMISPMFHAAALGMGVLPVLLKGGTVVLEVRFEAEKILQMVERLRVTSLSGVPTTFQMLSEHPSWSTADLSSLQMLTCGGSAVPLRVLDAYERRGLAFTGGYGMTETAPGATSLPPRYSRRKIGSAGLPHFFTDIRIVDGTGAVVPVGQQGEILIQGPNVMSGYWNRPEADAGSYSDDGWFRSGDVGYTDEEGFLFISDRLKDMIISGGENIYPIEIEQAIQEIESVQSVAVVGVPDEKWGEVPRAYVQLRFGQALTEEELTRHLAGRIARYKIPKSIVIVEDMPRTSSGKIRKRELRRPGPEPRG